MTDPLHVVRRNRFAEAARTAQLDALLLGRPNNVRYVSGIPRVIVSGTRPFAPTACLVAGTGELYLQSASDSDLPSDVSPDHLFGQTWNPATLVSTIAAIPAVAAARRVGVDGMTPAFRALLAAALPQVDFVPVEDTLRSIRRIKSEEEIERIRVATQAATTGLAAAAEFARAGTTELQLHATYRAAIAAQPGIDVAKEGSACVLPTDGAYRQLATDRALRDGDLVAFDFAVLFDGYEGGLGRTVSCGSVPALPDLQARWRAARDELLAACTPGARGADLRAAFDRLDMPPEVAPPYEVGIGSEPPLDDAALLAPGMVLSLQVFLTEPGAGSYFGRDLAVVTRSGTELLTPEP